MTTIEKRRLLAHVARVSIYKAARFRAARQAHLSHVNNCQLCRERGGTFPGGRCPVGGYLVDAIPRLTWTRPGDWRDSNAERT